MKTSIAMDDIGGDKVEILGVGSFHSTEANRLMSDCVSDALAKKAHCEVTNGTCSTAPTQMRRRLFVGSRGLAQGILATQALQTSK